MGYRVGVDIGGSFTDFALFDEATQSLKTLKVFSNMMIFANLVQAGTAKPTDIINSNVGEPANVTSGLSEQFKVHGNPDEIMQMVPLGENLAIYSRLTVTAGLRIDHQNAQYGDSIRKPLVTDFKDSSQIEQDASVILLLHRELAPDGSDTGKSAGTVDLIVGKNRNGGQGREITLNFQGEFGRLRSIAPPSWTPTSIVGGAA